jgi:hypothetical protein
MNINSKLHAKEQGPTLLSKDSRLLCLLRERAFLFLLSEFCSKTTDDAEISNSHTTDMAEHIESSVRSNIGKEINDSNSSAMAENVVGSSVCTKLSSRDHYSASAVVNELTNILNSDSDFISEQTNGEAASNDPTDELEKVDIKMIEDNSKILGKVHKNKCVVEWIDLKSESFVCLELKPFLQKNQLKGG